MVPFTTNGLAFQNVDGAFGAELNWIEQEDGTLLHKSVSDNTKELYKYLNRLYQEGLLDPEFSATNNPMKQEKFASGQAVFMGMYWPDFVCLETLTSSIEGATWDVVPPLKDANGRCGFNVVLGASPAGVFVVPKTSTHPEDAIKFVNQLSDYEVNKLFRYGEEGVHWEEKENGERLSLPAYKTERNIVGWYTPATRQDLVEEMGMTAISGETKGVAESCMALNKPEFKESIHLDPMLLPISDEWAKAQGELNSASTQWGIGFIMGEISFDQWDEYVAEMNGIAGDAFAAQNQIYADSQK